MITIIIVIVGTLAIADAICFFVGRQFVTKNFFLGILPGSGFVALWRKIKYERIS